MKRGVLLGRERVEITAHGIDALSDVLCGSSRRPLEQQVFEEVRDARQLGGSSRLPTPIHAPTAMERDRGMDSATTRRPPSSRDWIAASSSDDVASPFVGRSSPATATTTAAATATTTAAAGARGPRDRDHQTRRRGRSRRRTERDRFTVTGRFGRVSSDASAASPPVASGPSPTGLSEILPFGSTSSTTTWTS